MGLDMYLLKKENINDQNEQQVAYWRKANHIHGWFVDNVQGGVDDCSTYPVSREDLQKLLEKCHETLEFIKTASHKTAVIEDKDIKIPYSVILTDKDMEDLLPRRSGFFFGGKDYDEYYVMDTKYTIDILTSILAEEDGLFYYHSSW